MQPGEPEFLKEDTDAAIALAEEERDTCPSCGMPKAWCRDAVNQFAFEGVMSTCWATEALERYRNTEAYQKLADATRAATQASVRFRDGYEPDVDAGLELPDGE